MHCLFYQDNNALINTIVQSFANQWEKRLSDCTNITRYYYADHNGMMITYPCYDNDPVYEDDQCTVNKILYDPRIKPVSDHCSTFTIKLLASYSNQFCMHGMRFNLN